MNRGQSLCLVGGIALLLGLFLPWETIHSTVLGVSRSMAGYQGDSAIAGVGGLILVLVAVLAKGTAGKRYSRFAVVLALIAGLVAVIYLPAAATGTKPESGIIVTSGPGLYLSLIGSVLALVGGLQTVPVATAGVQPFPPMAPVVNYQSRPPTPVVRQGAVAPSKASVLPIIAIALSVWAVLSLLVIGLVLFGGR